MMLFWEALQCNKRFRSFIIDTDRVHDFVILIMYYALEYRLDPSKSGVVRMCVFVLQTLSTEFKFGKSLNKRFEGQNSLPASVRIPSFSGSYADYLIIVSSRGWLVGWYFLTIFTVYIHINYNKQRKAECGISSVVSHRWQYHTSCAELVFSSEHKTHTALFINVCTNFLTGKRE